jgi:Methyltransferase domain
VLAHRLRYFRSAWSRRRSRARVIRALPRDGVGAEVGTWKGDFAERLLRGAAPARLHLVDPWEYRQGPEYRHAMLGQEQGSQTQMDAVHAEVCARFAGAIADGRVIVHRASSLDAASQLEPLDWAYIDGDHTYEAVLADLEAFYALLRPGGVLAGDDYGVVGWWGDAVIRAVDEFAGRHGCRLQVVHQQFILRKPA